MATSLNGFTPKGTSFRHTSTPWGGGSRVSRPWVAVFFGQAHQPVALKSREKYLTEKEERLDAKIKLHEANKLETKSEKSGIVEIQSDKSPLTAHDIYGASLAEPTLPY